ncbi:MAG TPA: hypothetical protein VFH70_00420, partial [Acidimicrobiales bacterium]|nr:hypothetical protein [Acidimicrobiales bacterium]
MADPTAPVPGNDPAAQSTESDALTKAQGLLAPAKAGPQNYGAGQNPFQAAANNVDKQKAAMLSAIANGGTAGRAMLDNANAALAAQ